MEDDFGNERGLRELTEDISSVVGVGSIWFLAERFFENWILAS